MKKILFVVNTMGCGGAERALLELLGRMDWKKYEIFLYVLMGQGELIRELPSGVRLLNPVVSTESVLTGEGRRKMVGTVLRAFLRNGGYLRKGGYILRNLTEMVRRRSIRLDKLLWRVVSEGAYQFEDTFDVAVAWMEGGSAYYVADHVKAGRKKAVIHIDYESAGYTKAIDGGCFQSYERIYTVSRETREHFLAVYPGYEEKVGILPNVVDQERIRRRSQEAGGFADGYEGIRLLTVGRLTRQKGYDFAIEVMKRLKGRGCRVRWYVLGEGDQRRALEKKIEALGLEEDFLLLGQQENPYPYYAQADIYVHATRFEGKSIAIQEAQTLGCAIVASDCNGNREQIEDGRDGILCALEPEAMAACIAALCDDGEMRRRLGSAAEKKEFAWKEELQHFLD